MSWLLFIPTNSQDNEELWVEEAGESGLSDDEVKEVPPDLPSNSPKSNYPSSQAIVTWVVRFLVLTQSRHRITDAAINAVLKLLSVLFVVLGRFSALAASIASIFPSFMHMLRKEINKPEGIVKFVVCQKCPQLYNFDKCVSLGGPNCANPVLCPYVRYPNHPQRQCRQP